MSSPTPPTRHRKFNLPLVKGVIMLALGAGFGFLSALTGISPQIAAAPMIVFLLGFQPAKAQGTALAYALWVAVGGLAGATAGGLKPDYLVGFLIALGATMGAVLVAKAAAGPRAKVLIRLGQSLAILLAIFVLGEAIRPRVGGPRVFPVDLLIENRAVGAFLVGTAVGLLAQSLQVAMAVFLVPALIYLAARPVPEAITTSLIVAGIASLLPTLSYSAKGAVDRGAGYWMRIGGLLGGMAGGMALAGLGIQSMVPIVLFGVAAMFLSGWTLSRT